MDTRDLRVGFVLFAVLCAATAEAESGKWVSRAALPTPGLQGSTPAGVLNNHLYIAGPATQVYDPNADAWSYANPIPVGVNYAASGGDLMFNRLYIAGGAPVGTGSGTDALQIYDITSDSWSSGPALPEARAQSSGAVVGTTFYVVGGLNAAANAMLPTLVAYDSLMNTWSTKAPMEHPRRDAAAASLNGLLYVVGGRDASSSIVNTVEAYDPGSDSWTTLAPMPTAREALVLATHNGILYAMGGFGDPGAEAAVESYNPIINVWTVEPALPSSHFSPVGGELNGEVHVVGDAFAGSGFHEAYLVPEVSLTADQMDYDLDNGPAEVTLTARASHTDGSTLRFTFAFADNPDSISTVVIDGQTSTNISYTYPYAGVYRPYVTVTEGDGSIGTTSSPAVVFVHSSVMVAATAHAQLTYTMSSSVAPSTITFTTTNSAGDAWTIDYDDGGTDSGYGVPPATLTHRYLAPGSYNVHLIMTDQGGGSDLAAQSVYLTAQQELTAELIVSVTGGTSPLDVTFDGCHSQPANDGTHIVSYTMDFGDGTMPVTKTVDATHVVACDAAASARTTDPSLFTHTYTVMSTARFNPVLTVTDDSASGPRTSQAYSIGGVRVEKGAAPAASSGGALGLLTLVPLGATALWRRRRRGRA